MDGKKIRNVLEGKGCKYLYHVNTVRTSLTFLEHGGLLSRGNVEANNLIQTPQNSDEIDKRFGLWNDIFFDSVDIHNRKKDMNFYGPVMFVLNLKILEDYQNNISVTKSNPIHWNIDLKYDDMYYYNEIDFESGYKLGDFRTMFIVKNSDIINFEKYLVKIIVDISGLIYRGFDISNSSMNELVSTASRYCPGIKNLFEYRNCGDCCNCKVSYAKMYKKKIFQFFNV